MSSQSIFIPNVIPGVCGGYIPISKMTSNSHTFIYHANARKPGSIFVVETERLKGEHILIRNRPVWKLYNDFLRAKLIKKQREQEAIDDYFRGRDSDSDDDDCLYR